MFLATVPLLPLAAAETIKSVIAEEEAGNGISIPRNFTSSMEEIEKFESVARFNFFLRNSFDQSDRDAIKFYLASAVLGIRWPGKRQLLVFSGETSQGKVQISN